jgi:D-alanyl-D-alanine carboxypeptidase
MMAISATLHKSKDEKVTVTRNSIEDGYDLGLKEKQVWKLSELLKYTLVFSSNDGAEIVADSFGGKDIFVKQMNEDAQVLGLELHFTDPAGRDLGGNIGGKGTVLEAAKLFSVARKIIPEILDSTTKKRETVSASSGRISGVPNTNQAIETLPGAEASKTGYTDMAGGNLGVVVDISIGRPVVIVVLGSTREGRFRDMSILYNALRKSIATQ